MPEKKCLKTHVLPARQKSPGDTELWSDIHARSCLTGPLTQPN